MEMVEGGTRAEVASVLSEKLLAELSDRSQVALHPRSIWRSAAPVWAPATGVEPRVRLVECLESLLCHARIATDVYLIAMISIISTVLLRLLIRVPPLALPHPPRPRRRSTPRRTHAHPAQDAATHASTRRHTRPRGRAGDRPRHRAGARRRPRRALPQAARLLSLREPRAQRCRRRPPLRRAPRPRPRLLRRPDLRAAPPVTPTRPPLQPASLRSDDMLRVEGDFR
jgi:hypothetical protein